MSACGRGKTRRCVDSGCFMALSLSIRYHLIPATRIVFKRVRVGTVVATIPVAALIGFAYWRYWVAVQQLPAMPLSLPEARLCVLLALFPILFIRTSGTRRDSVFYSMATECPAVTLKIMILRNVGSRITYALLLLLAVTPLVGRLATSIGQSLLHLSNDGLYLVTCCTAATLIDVASGGRRTRRVWLATCFLSLLGIETMLLFNYPWADITIATVNAALLGACWALYIPRINPLLIQEYFNGPVVITERRSRRRGGILDSLNVETRVYLKTFLLSGNSVVPVAAALAVYVYLVLFLIRGTPMEDPLAMVMMLGFGVAFFYSSIFVESSHNFNLLFGKVHAVTFFRLTRLILAPHCALIGILVAVIVALIELFGMMRLTPFLMLMSYVVVLPLLSWSISMIFLNRRLLSGLYNTTLALTGLVLSVVAPAVYAVFAIVACAVMYRRGMLRYAAFMVEEWK